VAVPKASLLAGNTTNMSRFDLNSSSSTGFSLQPLIDPNGTGTANFYSDYDTPGGSLK
jgi:hypothetical protein